MAVADRDPAVLYAKLEGDVMAISLPLASELGNQDPTGE